MAAGVAVGIPCRGLGLLPAIVLGQVLRPQEASVVVADQQWKVRLLLHVGYVDGVVLERDPFVPTAHEMSKDVPVMIGWNKDEMTLFTASQPSNVVRRRDVWEYPSGFFDRRED